MRSFNGDEAVKRALLAALDERIASASLAPITVGGHTFAPFEFAQQETYHVAERALGVPMDLLYLGAYLFEGFPEDAEATAEHLRDARGWLAEIPVGADLTGVAREFTVWRLTDPRDGVLYFVRRPPVRKSIELLALALELKDPQETVLARAEVARLARGVGDEIPARWQSLRHVSNEVYAHLRALETALCAAELDVEPRAAMQVAHASVFGSNGVSIPPDWSESDAMERWLLARLRA